MTLTKPLRALELFAGAGGSTALLPDDVRVVAAFDFWEPAQKVYQANHPGIPFYSSDISKYSDKFIESTFTDIDLIIASPDCTSHSIAKGNGKRSNKSRNTAFQVARFARITTPRWVIIENVARISDWKRYDELIEDLEGLGFSVFKDYILNAADFGVPQARKRRFIICSRDGIKPEIITTSDQYVPVETVIEQNGKYKYTNLNKKGRAEPTLNKAKHAINELGGGESFLIVYYGSGKHGKGGWQRTSVPLRTITTLDRFAYVKPSEDGHKIRMLQPEELKKAMGFPSGYKLDEVKGLSRRERVKLMGNAVCPPVMKAIIEGIIQVEKTTEQANA